MFFIVSSRKKGKEQRAGSLQWSRPPFKVLLAQFLAEGHRLGEGAGG
jgi:hypothetical protein